MNELRIVFVTELLRKLRSRIFWFATLGGVLAIALFVEAPVLFENVARSSSSDIVLAGPLELREHARKLLEAKHNFHVVASVTALPANVTVAYLEAHGKAGAAVAISQRGRLLHVDVYPRDLSAFDEIQFRDLVPLNIELATGTPAAGVERASTIEQTMHPLDRKFADSRAAAIAHGIAFGLIFILYLAIIVGSQSVMSSVAEEKTSRIAEILVATIRPANLLAGKTLAAAVIALVQIGLWIATAAVLLPSLAGTLAESSAVTASGGDAPAALLAIEPGELVAFLGFFILGYLEYATLYAAAASLISRTEDLGSVATPVILPVIGAFIVAQFALLQPGAPLVVTCSFIPFLSPFIMFTRIAISSVPVWQILVALAINVAAVGACFWAAGKIYRVGMLLYGKLPTPKQLLAVLRA